MKHTLRSPFFKFTLCAILFVMCAPVAFAAGSAAISAPALTTGPGLLTAGALLFGGTMLLSPQGEGEGGGGGSSAAPKAEDETKLTLGQRLSAALSSKASLQAKITQLEQTSADQKTKLDTQETELKDLRAKVAKLEAEAAEVAKHLEAAEKEAKDLAAKDQDLDKRASEQAKQIVRGTGIEAGKLPAATEDNLQASTTEEAMKEYGKLSEKDPLKAAEYYAAHIAPKFGKN